MSSIGGIYYFNSDAIAAEGEVRSLGDVSPAMDPDGRRELVIGPIGMTHRAFHTNNESRLETQPLLSRGRYLLAWDGRLDNREELLSQLSAEIEDNHTDVALVMAAYLRWSDSFLPKLIGDFALSLWDQSSKSLVLARDPVGVRPLVYHLSEQRVIWASNIQSILARADVPIAIEDEFVAGYLVSDPEPELTAYKNIRAVKPGHAVWVRSGLITERRFWCLDPAKKIRYKTDGEYEEQFLHVFKDAVRSRLRTDGPVFAELSGGLDSSSIVCMADHLISRGEAQAPRLEPVSQVYNISTSADERKFIAHVEERRGRRGYHFCEDEYPLLSPISDEGRLLGLNPCLVSEAYHRGLAGAMRGVGARVLLSGQGGDEMTNSRYDPFPELGDLMQRLRIIALHRCLTAWSRARNRPYLDVVWKSLILPSLPRRFRPAPKGVPLIGPSSWFTPEYSARMDLRERLLGPVELFGFRSPSEKDQVRGFLSVTRNIGAGYRTGISEFLVSYPFTHRPLVEFLQAIPHAQRIRPGETRSLLRRALRDVLPEKIIARKGKTNPREALFSAVAREYKPLSELFLDARVCSLGYLKEGVLQDALRRARAGLSTQSVLLLKTVALEVWLRSLESTEGEPKRSTVVDEAPATLSNGGAVTERLLTAN